MGAKMKAYFCLTLLVFFISRRVESNSLNTWTEKIEAYLDNKIANDPYGVYIDIKSDVVFLNDQCKQYMNDISYQIASTENIMKTYGAEVSEKSSILSEKISAFPNAISEINENFVVMKGNISGLPLKSPCFSKVSSAIDNIKGVQVDNLDKNIEFNENNKVVSANMLRILSTMHEFANDIEGPEMDAAMQEFRNEIAAQLGKIMKEYTRNVYNILMNMERQMNLIEQEPAETRAQLAQNLKANIQGQLEMARAKMLMDLKATLTTVMQSLSELHFDVGDLINGYLYVLQRAGFMVDSISSNYGQRVEGTQTGSGKITKIAGLTVTYENGTKVDPSAYIPAYTLTENEDIYSAAQAGLDLMILIVGKDENEVPYTRKIFKIYVNDKSDLVYMLVYKEGEIVEEIKYVYHYDKEEC